MKLWKLSEFNHVLPAKTLSLLKLLPKNPHISHPFPISKEYTPMLLQPRELEVMRSEDDSSCSHQN